MMVRDALRAALDRKQSNGPGGHTEAPAAQHDLHGRKPYPDKH